MKLLIYQIIENAVHLSLIHIYGEENHIITHYVDVKTINRTLKELASVKQFIIGELNGRASTKNFNETKKPNDEVKDKLRKENYEKYGLSKSKMLSLIHI